MPTFTDPTVGGKLTASMYAELVAAAELQGLRGIIPTSVSGTGTTVGALGKVSLAAATAPAIDGVFTSEYEKYVIEIDGVGSANLNYNFVFRVGGSDVTTSNYDETTLLGRNSAASSATTVAQANWPLAAGSATLHSTKIELSYPAVAQATVGKVTTSSATNPQVAGTANGILVKNVTHRLSTAYDGFKITFSGGNFTGAIRVLGVNNL